MAPVAEMRTGPGDPILSPPGYGFQLVFVTFDRKTVQLS
jgi:hypothetical protein